MAESCCGGRSSRVPGTSADNPHCYIQGPSGSVVRVSDRYSEDMGSNPSLDIQGFLLAGSGARSCTSGSARILHVNVFLQDSCYLGLA